MCYLNKHFKGGNSIWEDTNSLYSLIDSFNTYPARSMPVPGSLLGMGVQGPVHFIHHPESFQSQLFF